jgi:hypothetical protein
MNIFIVYTDSYLCSEIWMLYYRLLELPPAMFRGAIMYVSLLPLTSGLVVIGWYKAVCALLTGGGLAEVVSFLGNIRLCACNHFTRRLAPCGYARSIHISGNFAFPLCVLKIIYSQQGQRNRVLPLFT